MGLRTGRAGAGLTGALGLWGWSGWVDRDMGLSRWMLLALADRGGVDPSIESCLNEGNILCRGDGSRGDGGALRAARDCRGDGGATGFNFLAKLYEAKDCLRKLFEFNAKAL